MKVRVKIWLDEDERIIFGEGVRNLLLAIQRTGSINRASEELNMSYRRAWEKIHRVEKRMGQTLVITQTGGAHGGGTSLTEVAREMLNRYDQLESEVTAFANKKFVELFGE
ncbi:MAG: LysR family transcriptional regulator [Firmicutes bacterium]|nr:LysR family transcriptional regulator [Bacillota bacterium]